MLDTILSALLLTVFIEGCVLLFIRERRWRVLLGSVVINICTNVPLSIWAISTWPGWGEIIVAELIIFAVETAAYFALVRNLRQAAAYSGLCNSISFLAGLLIELICIIFNIDTPLLY